jgi:ribosomal-protein-alanine N-acetyltransferase
MAWLRHPGTPTNRGVWLAEEHRGKGLMTEALAPVMEYAFTTLNLERVLVGNAVGNTKSRRIKEKSGAVLVRTEPVSPGLFVNPEYKEREIWELTKERWLASKLGDS